MDVREKLVELLDEAEEWADHKCDELDCETCYAGKMKGNCVQKLMVDRLISHGVTVQEWISVDDRLPNDNDRVIAFRPNEPETSAYKYCVMWGWSVKASLKHRGITHWCAMPQPPKGE